MMLYLYKKGTLVRLKSDVSEMVVQEVRDGRVYCARFDFTNNGIRPVVDGYDPVELMLSEGHLFS